MIYVLAGFVLATMSYYTGFIAGRNRVKMVLRNSIRTKQIEASHNMTDPSYCLRMLDDLLKRLSEQ